MSKNIKNTILLIMRILVGGMISYAGYIKLINMDQAVVTIGGLTGLPAGIVWVVALGEFISGLGIVLGVWTRLAALGTAVIMIGAVYFTKGQEMSALLLLIGSIMLAIVGGGKWVLLSYGQKHLMPDLPVAAKF